MTATATDSTPFPPGARIVVRDTEWLVRSCTPTAGDGYKITATGVSEFVRDESAVFFTALEHPRPALLRPEETTLVADGTPAFAMSRLYLEATLRRTPLPQSERAPRHRRRLPPRRAHLPAAPRRARAAQPAARASCSPTWSASARPWRSASSSPS